MRLSDSLLIAGLEGLHLMAELLRQFSGVLHSLTRAVASITLSSSWIKRGLDDTKSRKQYGMRRPPSAPARRPFRKPTVLSYWDAERVGPVFQ